MDGRIEVIDIIKNNVVDFDDPNYTVRIYLPNNEYIEFRYQPERNVVSLSTKSDLEIKPQATNLVYITSKKRS